jgi:hypothetical protein
VLATTEFKFEIPETFRVLVPRSDVTFRVVMLAVPRTYRFDPTGGAFRVPIDTPAAYATFPANVVHWDERIATFAAVVTRPY